MWIYGKEENKGKPDMFRKKKMPGFGWDKHADYYDIDLKGKMK